MLSVFVFAFFLFIKFVLNDFSKFSFIYSSSACTNWMSQKNGRKKYKKKQMINSNDHQKFQKL